VYRTAELCLDIVSYPRRKNHPTAARPSVFVKPAAVVRREQSAFSRKTTRTFVHFLVINWRCDQSANTSPTRTGAVDADLP